MKLQIPKCIVIFFGNISQNREYVQTHCKDRRNLFQFAYRKWYLHNIPQ